MFTLPRNMTEAMDLAITIVCYKDIYYVQSISLFLAVYIRCDNFLLRLLLPLRLLLRDRTA